LTSIYEVNVHGTTKSGRRWTLTADPPVNVDGRAESDSRSTLTVV